MIKENKNISADYKKQKILLRKFKEELIKRFDIKIEYLEFRNLINLSKDIENKPFRLFVAYYLSKVRLIDNF